MQMNIHGNVKASNVMINTDFSACLSDYGVTQLAERVEVSDTWKWKPIQVYSEGLSQKCDVYNYGVILVNVLAGPKALVMAGCLAEDKEKIKDGSIEFFEFPVSEGIEKEQAFQVLEIALACIKKKPEARPSMEHIVLHLGYVCSSRG